MLVEDAIVDSMIARAEVQPANEGDIYVSEPCVMKSNAGWYVGQVCIEFLGGQWVPMPYDRLSKYCKDQQTAQVWLDALMELEQ